MKLRVIIFLAVILTPIIVIVSFFVRGQRANRQPGNQGPAELGTAYLMTDYPILTIKPLADNQLVGLTPDNELFLVQAGTTQGIAFPDRRGSETAIDVRPLGKTRKIFIRLQHLATQQKRWVLYDLDTHAVLHDYSSGIEEIAGNADGDTIAYIFHQAEKNLLATAAIDGTAWQDWTNINPATKILAFDTAGIVTKEPLGDGNFVVKEYPKPHKEARELIRDTPNAQLSPAGQRLAAVTKTDLQILNRTDQKVDRVALSAIDLNRLAWMAENKLAVTAKDSLAIKVINADNQKQETINAKNATPLPTDWYPLGAQAQNLLVLTHYGDTQFLLAIPLGNQL